MIRKLLNKIKWDPDEKNKNYLITFIHRGIPGDRKTIEVKLIKNITKNFFSYVENDVYTYIPFHRILTIEDKETGKKIYSKK